MASSPEGYITNVGFGLFLVQVQKMFTLDTIRNLATVLNFPASEIDDIERHKSPSYAFVSLLKEKGVISPNDISHLTNSLVDIKRRGIAQDVAISFRKHMNKGTLPEQDAISDVEDAVESDVTVKGEQDLKPPNGIQSEDKTRPRVQSKDEASSVNDFPDAVEMGFALNAFAYDDKSDADCLTQMSIPFKDFLHKLGLEKGLRGKYSIRDSQEVSYLQQNAFEEGNIFEQFISRITSYDYRVHQIKSSSLAQNWENNEPHLSSREKSSNEDWFDDLKADDSCSDTIASSSARDVLFAILKCLDPFLLQEVLMKLSACHLAVPLLMPDSMGNITLNLWGLRKVSKSWYDSNENAIQTENVVSYPFPAVSAMRIGETTISKSNILNKLLGPAQCNDEHAYFLSREQDPQHAYWSKGTLECVWFLPNQDYDPLKICTAFALLNLRGDSSHFRPQVHFATKNSFATIVFCDSQYMTESGRAIVNEIKSHSHVILVISLQKRLRQKPQEKAPNLTIIFADGYNALEVSRLILEVLLKLLQTEETAKPFCIENSAIFCKELNIIVDEANKTCKEAKRAAQNICDLISQNFPHINKGNIFVLQKHWKQWAELDKDKRIVFTTDNIENEIAKIKSKKNALRKRQYEEIPSAIMLKFLKYFNMGNQSSLFFIRYLEYYLNTVSFATFRPLLKNLHMLSKERRKISSRIKQETTLNERCNAPVSKGKSSKDIKQLKSSEQDITAKERDCIRKIDENSLGLEYFVREIAQIAECHYYTGKDMKQYPFNIKHFPSFAAELLLNGYPIEIMDGDANHVPLKWVQEVLKTLSSRCGNGAKVYVISVLGIQSSGKSTLLNSMFGVQFAVRAGRCTKGAFMQLVSVHETIKKEIGCDFIVIIDTEGLGAPEKLLDVSPEHDNELATFALCNSDLTLINIGGQIMGEEMTNVLQIAAHAFIRMKEVDLKVECHIVQQFVADVTAEERNEAAMENIMIKLDNAIAVAAKEEGKDHLYAQFSDVFAVQNDQNDSNNVQYIPSLWRGYMSSPDHHYSTRVLQLKQSIMRSIQKKESKLTIMDFSQRITDVWNAIKKENFVFSFKNTKEITLFEELMKIYRAWISPVRVEVVERGMRAMQNIENSKIDRIQSIFNESVKTIEQLLEVECEKIKENLNLHLYSQKYREIKQYATSFYADLSTFKLQMINNVTLEISQFVTLSVQLHKKLPEEESLSGKLHENVALLASEIRRQINERITESGHSQYDHEAFIKQKFDGFWEKWMRETEKKYPVETFSKISEDIAAKVKKIIIQETQNKTLAATVLDYLEGESLNKYSTSSSYIRHPHHIQKATILFSVVDETASSKFDDFVAKIKKVAEDNEKFSENSVELLDEVALFIESVPMLDKATAICYFCSLFVRLANSYQVHKECETILHSAESLSAISKTEKIFLGDEIEETLRSLSSSHLQSYKKSSQKQKKRNKQKQTHVNLLGGGVEHSKVQSDIKNKRSLSLVLSNVSKKIRSQSWRATPWARSLENVIESVIATTEKRCKLNMNTADALDTYCRHIVEYCWQNVPSDNVQRAIDFSCDVGFHKFKEYGEQFLERYIGSNEYTMKFAQPVKYHNIQSKIDFILQCIDNFNMEFRQDVKRELRKEFVPKYGCPTFSFSLFLHLDRRFIRILPLRREEILRSVHERVTSIKKTFLLEKTYRAPFNTAAVSKVLSDTINNSDSEIFPNEILGPMLVHIGAWLIPFCAVTRHELEKSKNTAMMLRKEKANYFSQFKSLCSEKYDQMIAKAFVDVIVKTAKGSLKYKIYPELVRHFLVENDIFKVKRCFVGNVLVNICQRDSYQDAVEFINDFEAFSQRWIFQYVVERCMADALIKTTVDKCILDIKHAALHSVVKANEVLKEPNPDLPDWLKKFCESMTRKIAITCKETEIDKLKRYLSVSKLHVFSKECNRLLQDLDEILQKAIKLPATENLNETQQWLLNELPKQIHIELFDSFKGCTQQCQFCHAVCEEGLSGHPKHIANLHFPGGIHGYHFVRTKKLLPEICTSLVESDILYRTPPWVATPKYRPFKHYTVDFGTWYIQGIIDDKPTDYWKYIFAKFNKQFAERYGLKKAEIPFEWTLIKKEDALKCAKTLYHLK